GRGGEWCSAPNRTDYRFIKGGIFGACRQLHTRQRTIRTDRKVDRRGQIRGATHEAPSFLNLILYSLIVQYKIRVLHHSRTSRAGTNGITLALTRNGADHGARASGAGGRWRCGIGVFVLVVGVFVFLVLGPPLERFREKLRA